MKPRVTMKTVIELTRIGSATIFSWPVSPDDSHINFRKRSICWWLTIINNVFCMMFFVTDVWHSARSYNVMHVSVLLAEMGAPVMTTAAMVLCKIEETRLKVLLDELESFIQRANQEELDLIQDNVEKGLFFHSLLFCGAILGPILFILAPMVTEQDLPSEVHYPYSKDSTTAWALAYVSEIAIAIQVGSTAILDLMFANLVWYAGARVKMLATRLERAATHEEVQYCIREHQYLLTCVDKLKASIRTIATEAIGIAVISVVAAGLILMRHEQVAVAAFSCNWIGKPPEMLKDLLFIMHKAQIPVVIDVPGITPALTLQFYTSIMKLIFSYLTTLHAMFET